MSKSVVARYLKQTQAAVRVAKEFANPEALKDYMHEHPGADPKNHSVKKPGEETKSEEKPTSTQSTGDSLFDAEDLKGLESSSKQKVGDRDELFKQANEAHQQQLKWLNQGQGLDKVLGAKVVRGDKKPLQEFLDELSKETESKGPLIVIAPMKTAERSKQKVDADYGGDWSQLGDVVRSTVAVDTMDELKNVMSELKKSGLKLAQLPKDRFAKPTEAGYRDLMMKVTFPNGHIGEMQLHLKPILKAKEAGHHHYDVVRTIEAKAKTEGRTTMTDEEQKAVDDANQKSRDLYTKAWSEATSKATKTARMGTSTKYYDWDGLAAIWEAGKFPVVYTKKGHRTVYELEKFFQEAQPISEADFKKLRSGK